MDDIIYFVKDSLIYIGCGLSAIALIGIFVSKFKKASVQL